MIAPGAIPIVHLSPPKAFKSPFNDVSSDPTNAVIHGRCGREFSTVFMEDGIYTGDFSPDSWDTASLRECYTPVDVVRDWRKEEQVVHVSTARDVHKRKWSLTEGWIPNTDIPGRGSP